MTQRRSPRRHKVGAGLSAKDRTMKTKNTRHVTAPRGTERTSIVHQHTNGLLLAAVLLSIGLTSFLTAEARGADDDAVDMIVELVSGSDNDMRELALQQIREKVPGKDATMRFVKLLPTLPTDVQVKLIDALGDRGDAAARPRRPAASRLQGPRQGSTPWR